MFQGLWYTWKLNDNAIPFQGVYIIECDGKVFHAGQTDNFERRRAEHVRDGGALLMATGPDYGSPDGLFYSPLGRIAPAKPAGANHQHLERIEPGLRRYLAPAHRLGIGAVELGPFANPFFDRGEFGIRNAGTVRGQEITAIAMAGGLLLLAVGGSTAFSIDNKRSSTDFFGTRQS